MLLIQDLWLRAPQSFIFIKNEDGTVTEYKGHRLSVEDSIGEVTNVVATKYPMYDSVLEVTMKIPLTDDEIREARRR